MAKLRSTALTALLLVPLTLSVVATAALIAFPKDMTVWNIGAWTLAVAAAVLIVSTPVAAYSTIRNAAARTWPRLLALTVAVAYLAVLALDALS